MKIENWHGDQGSKEKSPPTKLSLSKKLKSLESNIRYLQSSIKSNSLYNQNVKIIRKK